MDGWPDALETKKSCMEEDMVKSTPPQIAHLHTNNSTACRQAWDGARVAAADNISNEDNENKN